MIPESGLKLRSEYDKFEVEKVFPVQVPAESENNLCICAEILKGLSTPADCKLFGTSCTPENPAGACMVSVEGSCNVYFRYEE